MLQLINTIIHEFQGCFNRKKTWKWFLVILIGFMIRNNNRGVTSIISSLRLMPRYYHNVLHFFRSEGYTCEALYTQWIKTAMKHGAYIRVAGMTVLIGDHIKIPKEGCRMPDIQILHQDSQNSGKAEYIAGHNHGQVSAVITNGTESRSLPLITELQKSPPKVEGTNKPDGDTLVTQMVNLVHKAARAIGEPTVVAPDAYFSSKAAWEAADKTVAGDGKKLVEIVTRAQSNTVAFTTPIQPERPRRGKPRIYGDKVVLYDLFSDMSKFTQATMTLYGKKNAVRHLCLDLIWKPIKKLVRFVVVETASGRCVLMSSSLNLTAEEIITIYALRFKMETGFDEQKNIMGCFDYHFWTTALPKRKKWSKAESPDGENPKTKTNNAKRATQSFVCLATIAVGILTIIAFSHNASIWSRYPGWLRTRRTDVPTLAVVKETLYQGFHGFFDIKSNGNLFMFIVPLRRFDMYCYNDAA